MQQKKINKEGHGSLDKVFEQLIIVSFILTMVTKSYVCGMHEKRQLATLQILG